MSDRDEQIERVVGAFRERGPGGEIRGEPAWYDLDPAGREEAFARARVQRRIEGALDPEGLSTTVRAVLERIRGR